MYDANKIQVLLQTTIVWIAAATCLHHSVCQSIETHFYNAIYPWTNVLSASFTFAP